MEDDDWHWGNAEVFKMGVGAGVGGAIVVGMPTELVRGRGRLLKDIIG